MCGRFANQEDNTAAWDTYFDCDNEFATIADTVSVGYNIAPTQTIPVVTQDGWLAARWGMIGPWVKDASDISSKFATFNARSETVSEKATFRSAWSDGRRCVIPAIGYYEWQNTQSGKQPYFARLADESPLFFGGLYEPARESVCASCTIITMQASNAMARLFEAFVKNFYRKEQATFSVSADELPWQSMVATEEDLHLIPKMRFDISLRDESRYIVIDTKFYKEALSEYHEKQKVISSHLYQLFAYMKNLESKYSPLLEIHGALLYPTVNDDLDLTYNMHGHVLRITSVDLNKPWQSIHNQLLELLDTFPAAQAYSVA